MVSVLNRIFLRKLGVGKLILSGIGFVAGMTLMLLALQFYVRVNEYLEPGKKSSNFVIINKEVVMAHTLLGSRASFSTDEIEDLKKQAFVEDIGFFRSNSFEVLAHAGGAMGLYTELFFEAVPDRFIDHIPDDFTWQQDSDLPIIISQDFLDLYNFGYALGKGTPQVSRSTIKLVPIRIEMSGPQGRETVSAKVVGFSERIPSVLVPENFLVWANKHIGAANEQRISRAIVKVRTDGAGALKAYLAKTGFVAADERVQAGRVLSTLNLVMIAVLIVGMGFILFSSVIVIMNFSLLVAQAREEVGLLLQLGYSGGQLAAQLIRYLVFFLVTVSVLSALAWTILNNWMTRLLAASGIDVTAYIAQAVAWSGGCVIAMFFSIACLSIWRLIHSQQAG